MAKFLNILCCCVLIISHTNFASPREIQRKQNSGMAKAMMVQFLALLAGIAHIICAKDKDQRLQAATNIIGGLATVAQLVAGNIASDDENEEHENAKRAYRLLLEQEEFVDLIKKHKAELRTLLTQILDACQDDETNYVPCDA